MALGLLPLAAVEREPGTSMVVNVYAPRAAPGTPRTSPINTAVSRFFIAALHSGEVAGRRGPTRTVRPATRVAPQLCPRDSARFAGRIPNEIWVFLGDVR